MKKAPPAPLEDEAERLAILCAVFSICWGCWTFTHPAFEALRAWRFLGSAMPTSFWSAWSLTGGASQVFAIFFPMPIVRRLVALSMAAMFGAIAVGLKDYANGSPTWVAYGGWVLAYCILAAEKD